MNLHEETVRHFQRGARFVRAFAPDKTYIITKHKNADHYWVVVEEEGFDKIQVTSLEEYFREVFGIAVNHETPDELDTTVHSV